VIKNSAGNLIRPSDSRLVNLTVWYQLP